ncbi:MAG TPA: MspA family porin [Mycobacterium sp.]|jgi:MspA|nr:MspA family porin [Mycobacterium sp.]
MLNRLATVAAVCMLVPVGTASVALADDPPPPAIPAGDVGPPPDNGVVASGPPGIANTSDGRTLTVVAKDETQLPIAPLTTSLSSRDWLVGATFTGSGMGSAKGGSMEVGYQIGCAIEMDKIKLNGSIGVGTGAASLSGTGVIGLPGTLSFPIQGQVEVEPRPGTITNVVVDKKSYKGNSTRVTVKDIHIKVDNCVGASSLRSYAILTSSNGDTDDVVAYYGVTKVF